MEENLLPQGVIEHFCVVHNNEWWVTTSAASIPSTAISYIVDDDLAMDMIRRNGSYNIVDDRVVEATSFIDYSTEYKQEILDNLTLNIISYIDMIAQSKGYDNIASIGKYLGFDNPFRAECEVLGQFNAECWVKAYSIQNDVENGTIPVPTADELINMLPSIGV